MAGALLSTHAITILYDLFFGLFSLYSKVLFLYIVLQQNLSIYLVSLPFPPLPCFSFPSLPSPPHPFPSPHPAFPLWPPFFSFPPLLPSPFIPFLLSLFYRHLLSPYQISYLLTFPHLAFSPLTSISVYMSVDYCVV